MWGGGGYNGDYYDAAFTKAAAEDDDFGWSFLSRVVPPSRHLCPPPRLSPTLSDRAFDRKRPLIDKTERKIALPKPPIAPVGAPDEFLPMDTTGMPLPGSLPEGDMLEAEKPGILRTMMAEPIRMLGSSFLCGHGWPQFWAMTAMAGFTEAMCMFSIPDIAFASLNGGVDPCQPGDPHFNMDACRVTAGKFTGIFATAALARAIISIFSAPTVAKLCDRYGRKPFIIIRSLITNLCASTLLMVYLFDISILYYFASFSIVGVIPNMICWNLWVADRIEMRERTRFFAVLNLCVDMDRLVVPIGIYIGSRGFALYSATIAGWLCFILSVTAIHESLPPEKRQALKRDQPAASACDGYRTICGTKILRVVGVVVVTAWTIVNGTGAVFLPWLKERFGMEIADCALYMAMGAFTDTIVQLFLVKPLADFLGLKGLILVSLVFGFISMAAMVSVPSFTYMYGICWFQSLAVLCAPALDALFLNLAPPEKQGPVQAVYSQIMGITKGLGPAVYGAVMAYALQAKGGGELWKDVIAPNAVWFFGMVMNVVCQLIIAIRLPKDALSSSGDGI